MLESFTKQSYNLESILDSAEALKYIRAIRKEFEKEIENPSDDLVRLLVNKFLNGHLLQIACSLLKNIPKEH